MIRFVRDFRVVPVLLVAAICLFALKTFGLVFSGGYTLAELVAHDGEDVTGSVAGGADASRPAEMPPAVVREAAAPKKSWAREMFNFPDITGSAGDAKPAPKPAESTTPKGDRTAAEPAEASAAPASTPVSLERLPSRAERAVLERLQERRLELDARARDLEMRESLIKAAEKRLEARMNEIKDAEARLNAAIQQKEESEAARFKNLVTMYENMKAKDAAKIFDRLDIKVLVDVATQINPRRMSDILAQMGPENAERLTVELASRARDKGQGADLPKIEGRAVN